MYAKEILILEEMAFRILEIGPDSICVCVFLYLFPLFIFVFVFEQAAIDCIRKWFRFHFISKSRY